MDSSPISWLNGGRVDALPLPDRGLEFGDGVFETLLAHRGLPLFLSLHIDRLRCGVDMLALGLDAEIVEDQLQAVTEVLERKRWEWASIRITVTRGSGERGYAPPDNAVPSVIIQAYPMSRNAGLLQQPIELGLGELQLSTQPALAGLKHLNRLEQVLAAREASKRELDDLLMLDQSENVVSCIAGNVFLVRKNQMVTPPIVSCGVAGTRRRLILERWAAQCGYDVSVAPVTIADAFEADEIFCSNSLVTTRSVAKIGDQTYASREAANAIFDCFLQELK